MTVVGLANCGSCGIPYLARDEPETAEPIAGYPIVLEAAACPRCAAPIAHPDTLFTPDVPDRIPAGGGR